VYRTCRLIPRPLSSTIFEQSQMRDKLEVHPPERQNGPL
jgi:hypothetical protein